jgi:hypothetical protein
MSDTLLFNDRLPPELMAAPRAFIEWSRAELLREQAASTPTESLYHYTDETALRGFLKRHAFWCFSHTQQKDPREFEYALRVAMDVLERQRASDDFFKHHFAECVLDMLRENKLSGPFEFYLFSVSRHRDHGPRHARHLAVLVAEDLRLASVADGAPIERLLDAGVRFLLAGSVAQRRAASRLIR